jgi:hypothetical protein
MKPSCLNGFTTIAPQAVQRFDLRQLLVQRLPAAYLESPR